MYVIQDWVSDFWTCIIACKCLAYVVDWSLKLVLRYFRATSSWRQTLERGCCNSGTVDPVSFTTLSGLNFLIFQVTVRYFQPTILHKHVKKIHCSSVWLWDSTGQHTQTSSHAHLAICCICDIISLAFAVAVSTTLLRWTKCNNISFNKASETHFGCVLSSTFTSC